MPKNSGNYRTLIVDDDPISRAMLFDLLASSGRDVVTADSADTAKKAMEDESVRLIVADWIMPQISGMELCRWVRVPQRSKYVFFAMLTVYSEKQKLVEAFDAGVDDFLSKPVNEQELLARLRAWDRHIRLQDELTQRHLSAMDLNRRLSELNSKLHEQASEDELTGLPNRREAMQRLHEALQVSARYSEPLACAIIDVDRFKHFNDSYGHAAGDQVLRHVGRILRECGRTSDQVFRLGGDEFMMLFPRTGLDAAICAERCRAALAESSIQHEGHVLQITISVGLGEWNQKMTEPAHLLREADTALYAAKAEGRNRLHVRPAA